MANDIVPQDLLIYRRILNDSLVKITNEMYAQNKKISYKVSFVLVDRKDKPSVFISTAKPLYLFSLSAIDKTKNPIGETRVLYNNYYPKEITESVYIVERRAIQEWFTNATKALYNYIHDMYMEDQRKAKAIFDERSAQGVTENVVNAEIEKFNQNLIAKREKEIMAALHPNIIM